MSRAERRALVERENPALPVSRPCRLLAVSRSLIYRKPAEVSEQDRAIVALIDRQYLARPYYGSRRMAAWLATQGHLVNRKRVRRLMRLMGLVAIYQRPNTSKAAAVHKVYPYLLGGLTIERVNQVWCSDVTYIPMAKGFLYLVVIMDWVSRAVLAWRLSNTLGAEFCVEALEEALARYGRPEIFNTDQSLPSRKRGVAAWTTSSSSDCGEAANTKRSTSMPMRASLRPRPALAPGSASTTRSASTRAWAIARRARPMRQNAGGYVDDRQSRPALPPPLPEQARKAGKCSPSPTYPPAQPSTAGLILIIRNGEPTS
jgi:putative transposase